MLQIFKGNVQSIDIYFKLRRQEADELFQILGKIAVVIQAVDQ